MSNKVGLLVIGFGTGVFSTIASSLWPSISIVLRVVLLSLVVSASFVGINLLRKDNKTYNEKNHTTD